MLVAVYGTLRKGDYNYDRYIGGGLEPLGTEEISGFDMFNLGGAYPYIARGDGTIQVEIFDIGPDKAHDIERMERGAGYDMTEVNTSFGRAQIFYMTEEQHQDNQSWGTKPPKILSGDWFEWLSKYQPERLAS